MAFRRTLLLSILSALCTTADSFSVRCPSWAVISTTPVRSLPTSATCLFAEEDNETEASGNDEPTESGETAEPEEAEAASNADTDILSSPAFLKRKIEVLKSDVAATENEIEEARERAEAGKAEWGPQLDDLRKEVSQLHRNLVCLRDDATLLEKRCRRLT